ASAEEVATALQAPHPVLTWSAAGAVAGILAVFSSPVSDDSTMTPARLAVLPIAVEGPGIAGAAGIAADIADRLTPARSRFTVIAPEEALRNGVDNAFRARTILGATHVLRTTLRQSGAQITASASVDDTAT